MNGSRRAAAVAGQVEAIVRNSSARAAIWAAHIAPVRRVPWTKTIAGAPGRPGHDWSTSSRGRRELPCSTANSAACVRLVRPSLARMFETWVRAVRSAIPSSAAIALFDRPRATQARTSRSRAVRSSRPARCRRRRPAPRPRHRASGGRRSRPRPGRGGPRRRAPPGSPRQVVRLGVLEQEAARAGLERGGDPVLLDEAGERDDLDRRAGGLELGGRGDAVEPGIRRSMTTTSGRSAAAASSAARAVGRLADDLEVVVQVEEVAHARAGPSRGRRRAGPGSGRARPRTRRGPRPGPSTASDSIAGATTVALARGGRRWRITAAARIASAAERPGSAPAPRRAATPPARRRRPARTASGCRPASRRSSRIPVRNRIDGMAAANSPVKASSGRTDGSRSG